MKILVRNLFCMRLWRQSFANLWKNLRKKTDRILTKRILYGSYSTDNPNSMQIKERRKEDAFFLTNAHKAKLGKKSLLPLDLLKV